jgi:hypothetical protein
VGAVGWEAWLKLTELLLIVLVAAKIFGQFWQRREDVGNMNIARLDAHDRRLDDCDGRLRNLETINVARRLSIGESGLANLRTELYRDFVLTRFCDERTHAFSKERNHDHPSQRS